MTGPANVHGTAIVIGETGLLFVGPSGAGKSAVALHCIMEARWRGLFSALVSDDQVLVTEADGELVARAPASIAGLLEVRGAGIVRMATVETAVLHRAIRPIEPSACRRREKPPKSCPRAACRSPACRSLPAARPSRRLRPFTRKS